MENIFITGLSGCLGSYLWDELKNEEQFTFFILARDKNRLPADVLTHSRVVLIEEPLENFKAYQNYLTQMDYIIHLATQWFIDDYRVNVDIPFKIFEAAAEHKIKKIIYFSTASILNKDNELLPQAKIYGTKYIKSKFQCYQKLKNCKNYGKIISIFPTLLFGGDAQHRYSYASTGLKKLLKKLPLLRFLSLNLTFHFIHAREAALLTKYLLKHNNVQKQYVLGRKKYSFNKFIEELCSACGIKVYFKIPIIFNLFLSFLMLTPFVSRWDRFCFIKRKFTYECVQAEDFGLISPYPTLESMIGKH